MPCRPSLSARSASASPTRRFRSSDSTTHGPAMRNGEAPAPKCCAMSVAAAGELRRPLRLGEGRRAPGLALLPRRAHEPGEQWVWPGGSGFELGVELAADEPGVIGQLDHLDQGAVRGEPGAPHSVFGEHVAVGVGHFVAVTMPFAHLERSVGLRHPRAGTELAGIRAQAHRAAHFLDAFLRTHQRDHWVLALGREFARVGVWKLDHVARELDDRRLQPETNPEERELVLARPADRLQHAFHAPYAEAPRHEEAVIRAEQLARGHLVGEALGREPLDLYAALVRDPAVYQRFVDALVAVRELGVLPHHADAHPVGWTEDLLDHLRPGAQIGLLGLEVQAHAHFPVEPLLVQLERDLVDRLHILALHHT